MHTMETVTISREEFDCLKDAALLLDAFEEVGVYDWSGYNSALEFAISLGYGSSSNG